MATLRMSKQAFLILSYMPFWKLTNFYDCICPSRHAFSFFFFFKFLDLSTEARLHEEKLV